MALFQYEARKKAREEAKKAWEKKQKKLKSKK